MAVVNVKFPKTRSAKRSKVTTKTSQKPFDPSRNQLETQKARATLALYYLMK